MMQDHGQTRPVVTLDGDMGNETATKVRFETIDKHPTLAQVRDTGIIQGKGHYVMGDMTSDKYCPCCDSKPCAYGCASYRTEKPEKTGWRIQIDAQTHQLHAARYAYHKTRCKMYGDSVRMNLMSEDEARERYRLSMLNYDELIVSSANGSVTEADQADMDVGFTL